MDAILELKLTTFTLFVIHNVPNAHNHKKIIILKVEIKLQASSYSNDICIMISSMLDRKIQFQMFYNNHSTTNCYCLIPCQTRR